MTRILLNGRPYRLPGKRSQRGFWHRLAVALPIGALIVTLLVWFGR